MKLWVNYKVHSNISQNISLNLLRERGVCYFKDAKNRQECIYSLGLSTSKSTYVLLRDAWKSKTKNVNKNEALWPFLYLIST